MGDFVAVFDNNGTSYSMDHVGEYDQDEQADS